MPQIIIIEDSSIYDLGGGQRITLEAIQCLQTNKENNLYLFDVGSGNNFREKVNNHKIYSKFFGIKSIPEFLYKLPIIIFQILKKIENKRNLYLYPTTKKGLIIAVSIKFIYRHVAIIFHQHSSLGFLFDTLKIFAHTVIIPGVIAEKYSKKTVVIQNPINIEKSKLQSNYAGQCDNIIIGFIGSLTPHKGFDLFVEVLASNELDALIAGSGPLENLITNHNNLKYLGYINEAGKKNFYNKIDILVFPSVVEETFSLVCFEAIFNYVPVVCFDIGFPSKIISKYDVGTIADEKSVSSLNIAIQKCIGNLNVLSSNCSLVIDDFDNLDFRKKLLKVFSPRN